MTLTCIVAEMRELDVDASFHGTQYLADANVVRQACAAIMPLPSAGPPIGPHMEDELTGVRSRPTEDELRVGRAEGRVDP